MITAYESMNNFEVNSVNQLRASLQDALGHNFIATEEDIATLIIYVMKYASLGNVDTKWDGKSLGEAIASMYKLDWELVFRKLDHSNLSFESPYALKTLIDFFLAAYEYNKQKFYLDSILEVWTNKAAQASFLKELAMSITKYVNASSFSGQRIISSTDFKNASIEVQAHASVLEKKMWNVAKFVEFTTKNVDYLHEVVEIGINTNIELIFLGTIREPPPWNSVQEAIIAKGIQTVFKGHSSSLLVFHRLMETQCDTLTAAFRDLWSADPSCIERLCEIADEIDIISRLSEMQPYAFALDVLSSSLRRRSDIDISAWLKQKCETLKNDDLDIFLLACLDFLSGKAQAEANSAANGSKITVSLRVDVVAAILKLLMNSSLPQDSKESMKVIQIACLQVYPRLFAMGFGKDDIILKNFRVNAFSKDVEKEVEQKFQELYDHETTITEVVIQLRKLKHSDEPRDLDVFACTLHSLFDEYRFFPDYPVNALAVTAVLFGSLIQYELLSVVPLVVALGYVYEALLEPANTNMFRFGVQALIQFQERLEQYQHYCAWILDIPHFASAHPEIIAQIKQHLHSPMKPSIEYDMESQKEAIQFTGLVLDLDLHDGFFYRDPDELSQDKILFAINNLSQQNFTEKLHDVQGLLIEPYYNWFSAYLVQKRACREPNFHLLYIKFLDSLHSANLFKHVQRETLAQIFALIKSKKTVFSTAERSLLKNLGLWLGALTLNRNKPIKLSNIDLKQILIEGYKLDRLIVVLPFVCKVMEGAFGSIVFEPPNPWTMSIIRLLVELFHFANLKINLKFEIEVICKKLNLNLNSITPSNTLTEIECSKNQENEMKLVSAFSNSPDDDLIEVQKNTVANEVEKGWINSPEDFLQKNNIRKLISTAIEQIILEVITPVVDRAVAISVITSKILITKDFAGEINISQIRHAGNSLASFLTAGLSLVTCREPIRLSLSSILQNLIMKSGVNESEIDTKLLERLVDENIDIVFDIVEKMAHEKAIHEIDLALNQVITLRKNAEDSGNTKQFIDMANYYPMNLPDILAIKPGGLSQIQLFLYQNIGDTELETLLSDKLDTKLDTRIMERKHIAAVSKPQHQDSAMVDQIRQILDDIHEKCFIQYDSLREVPLDIDLHDRLRLLAVTLSEQNSTEREEVLLHVCEDVLKRLQYQDLNALSTEVFVAVLEHIFTLSSRVSKSAVRYICEGNHYLDYNVNAYKAMIKSGAISVAEIDKPLSLALAKEDEAIVEFATNLILQLATSEPPVVFLCDFINSLEALSDIRENNHLLSKDSLLNNFFDILSMKKELLHLKHGKDIEIHNSSLQLQFGRIIMEWVTLNQYPNVTAERRYFFISHLLKFEILQSEQALVIFFETALSKAIEAFENISNLDQRTNSSCYLFIDQFAKLILQMTIYSRENADSDMFSYYLSLIVLVAAHFYERESFNQKTINRLFSSLIWEISNSEDLIDKSRAQALRVILADSLLNLQPLHFPKFAVSWLSLISHRALFPNLLKNESSWDIILMLLLTYFRFIAQLVSNPESQDILSTRLVLKGATGLILVMVQDFPNFVNRKIFYLVNYIPIECIQLRNILLSAIPAKLGAMVNPFHNHIDLTKTSRFSSSSEIVIDFETILGDLRVSDYWLRESDVKPFIIFFRSAEDEVQRWMRMHAVLIQDLIVACHKTPEGTDIDWNSSLNQMAFSFVLKIIFELNLEERYQFFHALCNNFRYPNLHTLWFIHCFQYIWVNSDSETVPIQEQLTRVLLERLIPHQPHPWGLLVALHQLLKNPLYNFWTRQFMLENRQICKVFDSMQEHMSVSEERAI